MAQGKLDFDVPAHLKREFIFQTAGVMPPNGILFGFNTAKKVGQEAKKLGANQAILVTDEMMVQLGYAAFIKECLEKEGIKVDIFGKVEPEPHVETAEAIYEMTRKTKYNLVVGLGGGSSMDIAKLTSLSAANDLKPMDLIKYLVVEKKEVAKPGLKKIFIPTTSGTGSEVSKFFVVKSGHDKYFPGTPYAYAEIAIVDPGLTVSMPPKITAGTGLDALSHAVESIMNKLANPFYDSMALGAVELIAKYLRRATFNGQDLEARYYMAMGSMTAMIAMTGTGGLYAHSISYVLGAFQPTPHGIGCGIGLPYTMAFNLPVIEDKLALIARAMGERTDGLSTRRAAERAAETVYDLTADVKVPVSLKEMGFAHEDVLKMAEMNVTKYPRPNNPRPMSKEESLALFESMWEGKLTRL